MRLTSVFSFCLIAVLFLLIGTAVDSGDNRITIAAYVLVIAMGLAEYAIGFHRGYLQGYEEALETFESWVDEDTKPTQRRGSTINTSHRRTRDDDPTLN
jgi:cytochrome c biogenesis protein CcdA